LTTPSAAPRIRNRRPAADDRGSGLGDLVDAVPHLVWVAAADGTVIAYNRRIQDYGDLLRDPDGTWRWEALVHPDDLAATSVAWEAAVRTGRPYEHEHRIRMVDGSWRWHLSRGVRTTDAATGEPRWYGTATDIDTGRRAEDLLRQTQSSLALAMRGGRMGWWTRDLETDVVTWSPELEELFGLPAGSFGGSEEAFRSLVLPEDRPALNAAVEHALEHRTDYVVEFRFRHADGSIRWMDGRGRATYEGDRPVVLYGIGMDITERMETQAAIGTSEERLRLALEAGEFGLYDYDLVHGGMFWSPELHRILGTEATATAVAPEDAGIHPDDRDETLARFGAAQAPLSDGSFDFEYRVVRPDGAIRWVSTHGQTYFSDPEPSPDRRALRSIGIVVDITDRRQGDELRDVFVGMLSHELRTPVTAIYGGSQLLRRPNLDETSRREIVDDIVTESERLERLVENLLVLARAERHAVEGGQDPVMVRPMLDRIVADKRRRWPDARITVQTAPGLPPARWDEASFELVVRNLISNAIKYGDSTEIVVRAGLAGEAIELVVSDGGPGLPDEGIGRVFDLFYRADDARRRAQGAGIGLFVVRALVESAGGTAWAGNRSDGGAEFGIRIPAFVEDDDAIDAD
jgi:PAS domain S-box-containing protein